MSIRGDTVLAERAYAKINLSLDVLGKRPDGFHDVDMVMQTIDLSDLIWMEQTDGGLEVGASASHIPQDHRNLAYMAAVAFFEYTGIRAGVRIWIDKQIPVAAGLAGGSADAAAALRGLNRLFQTELTATQLAEIGSVVGSDVPFCVYGGCAVASGRGEQIHLVQHDLRAWVVLVHPVIHVSTGEVYGAVDPQEHCAQPVSEAIVAALRAGDVEEVNSLVSNGLTAAALRLYPEVEEVWRRAAHVARFPVHMSGSGPTLFCIVPAQSAGQRLYNAFRGFAKEVYLSRFV